MIFHWTDRNETELTVYQKTVYGRFGKTVPQYMYEVIGEIRTIITRRNVDVKTNTATGDGVESNVKTYTINGG